MVYQMTWDNHYMLGESHFVMIDSNVKSYSPGVVLVFTLSFKIIFSSNFRALCNLNAGSFGGGLIASYTNIGHSASCLDLHPSIACPPVRDIYDFMNYEIG